MNKKTIKALATFSMTLEKEQQKLYDKQKHIELSHNRKWNLLKQINNKLEFIKQNWANESLRIELNDIQKKIKTELEFNGRKNWGYTHKQIPGNYCGD